MALNFVTGVSGSGKSTVLSELKRLGYEAYDVDEAGPATAKWHHNETGYVHPKSSVRKEARTSEFLSNHSWKVPRQEVAELAKQAVTTTMFLVGGFANQAELEDLFGAVFALVIDDDTLKHRLASRSGNVWGQSPHELEHSLRANRDSSKRYKDAGYIVIDATQPTGKIVAEILAHITALEQL